MPGTRKQMVRALILQGLRGYSVVFLPLLFPLPCALPMDFVAETRKPKYLSHRPTLNRSAHPFLHWTCWDHKLPGSYQLHYPVKTVPVERGYGSKHSVVLEYQRSVVSTAARTSKQDLQQQAQSTN